VLNGHREVVVSAVRERLELLFSDDQFPDDPFDRVVRGYTDFVIPFEKYEGHPSRKAADGRWRIVCSLSLIDQLVERVFYTDFVNPVKEDYPFSGVCIGISFTDEGTDEFARNIPTQDLYSTDVSGFDRSQDASYIRACVDRRLVTLPNGMEKLSRAIRRHNECMMHPVFAVPTRGHAELYVSSRPKCMLSGRFVTTFFNSDIRMDLAFLAGASYAKACGDDCLEVHKNPAIVERYSELGYKLREPLLMKSDQIEFCSHSYKRGPNSASLSSWPKALHKLVTRPVTPELVEAFLHEVRHNPNLPDIARVLMEDGVLHFA
jgi:hypothetical protein